MGQVFNGLPFLSDSETLTEPNGPEKKPEKRIFLTFSLMGDCSKSSLVSELRSNSLITRNNFIFKFYLKKTFLVYLFDT